MDKKTASVLLYVLHHDLTSRSKITEKFPVSDEEADSIIAELVDHGVITPFQSNNYAVITDIDDLDEEMLQILEDEGLKKEFITDIIAGKYTTQEEISNIVRYNEDDLWSMIDDNVEIPSGKLLIRIKDPNHTYINSRDSILYVEDQRMAEYKDGKWFVDPPYAKYEYSPVIGPDHQILPGMEVTHYKEMSDEDILAWESRFNMNNDYKDLVFHVDDENEEQIYDALTIALGAIAKLANSTDDEPTKDKFTRAYTRIADIQNLIDTGKEVHNAVDG